MKVGNANNKLMNIFNIQKNENLFFFLGDSYTYTQFTLNPLLLLNGKRKNHLPSLYQCGAPGSPMARRTKHEIKSAQKLARCVLV